MPALAPIIGWLIAALAGAVGTFVGRVLISLGLGYITYQGVDTGIGWARDQVFAKLMGLPADVIGMLGVLQVGTSVSILASALVVRATISGLIGGAKRLVSK